MTMTMALDSTPAGATSTTRAECPDHGTPMLWHEPAQLFHCSHDEHDDGSDLLAPEDVYVEHDEWWFVKDDALWIARREE